MFSKGGTSLIAILLASSAAAAPLSAGQSDNVQAVIGAIKAQLKAQNISGDVFVDEVEAHLKDVGILDDKTISELNNEFEVSKRLRASGLNWNQFPLKTCPF